MKRLLILFGLLFTALYSQAQSIVNDNKTIRVTGYAELEIIPDEIYLAFTINERQEGKTTVTVEDSDKLLFTGLSKLNIDSKNLSIGDIEADHVKINWRKKDVQTSTNYHLKLKNSQEVYDVLNLLEIIKVKGAYIAKVNHSNKEELEKQVKIKAIKNAQDQALYLTSAIGEKVEGVIKIERVNLYNPFEENSNYRPKAKLSATSYQADSAYEEDKSSNVQFKKMKFTSKIDVIYKIQ